MRDRALNRLELNVVSVCQNCKHENREGNRFCTVCGALLTEADAVPAKLFLSEDGVRKEFDIVEAEWYVGRDASNDLVMTDQEVSGRHFRLERKEDVFRIVDLGSRNGTFINGQRITQPCVLQDGDLIKVGRTILTFES